MSIYESNIVTTLTKCWAFTFFNKSSKFLLWHEENMKKTTITKQSQEGEMIEEGWWLVCMSSLQLSSLRLSHPVMAWTVVELNLLGSLVSQIVSWMTHQERGKEQRVREENAAGRKGGLAEMGGSMREAYRGALVVRAQKNKVSSTRDTLCSQRCSLHTAIHAESPMQTQRNLWPSDACRLWRDKIL